MKQRSRSLPVLVLVAVVALVLGSLGTAVAGPAITKKKVKQIATTVVKKQAPSLSVAHATTAGSATVASGVVDGSITGTDLAPGLRTFSSSFAACTPGPEVIMDATTFDTCTIAAPQITADVISSDVVNVYISVGNTWQLPYTSNTSGEYSVINYFLNPGQITITRMSLDATPPGLPALAFRYTITPNSSGAAPAARPGPASTTTAR